MAQLETVRCMPLTIPNGSANSNVLKAREQYADAEELMLYAPAALDVLTFTIEVTDDPDAAAPVFRTLQSGSPLADVPPPAAGKAISFAGLSSAMGIRIHASGNVAADRVWAVSKQYRAN